MKKQMDPDRFVIGERVEYVNHVTGENLGLLEVRQIGDDFVIASRMFTGRELKFHADGSATWSCNLSIKKYSARTRRT